MYYAYVLQSMVDGRLYKGHCENIESRLRDHNTGKTRSTKGYVPWKLVYFETFESREEAIERERYLKSGVGREFLKTQILSQ
ncbi:GIY-YIG nuclease family protein [Muricauda sp. TY007]|uniref:GIY-YIG nuclease family protein n=1 Tax=Allomuricauda sp. TY007 TaxID=2683200 RepID=UPI0013C2876F|nr:GIY-YIG nuclease family protein [Muricauda sp. TY007]NDV15446.1 GIY-YIG nuclease family protein [Muricauda sp. TY007]